MIKAVVFDADKTLWDHHNISEFEEPLRLIDNNTVEDSKGRTLHLFSDVRETLKELKNKGLIVGLATWNIEEKTKKILDILDLTQYFDIIISLQYPYKFLMIGYIIIESYKRGISLKPNEILFLDDRRWNFGNIWLYLGDVKCLEVGKDITSYKDIFKIINGIDSE
ncbi:MAG: magnesium-dependent phosphatase-1 [Sulfolobaceae archaeon]